MLANSRVKIRRLRRLGYPREDLWGIVRIDSHDFDYEKYPSREDHPYKGNEILKERGWPDAIRRAIMSHAEYSGVTRDTPMEKALFACDELAGFITAVALIKPGKSLAEVDAKSVRKRMKDKAFARKVNRDDIVNGAAALGVELDEHISFCIEALRAIAGQLGLDGSAAKAIGETRIEKAMKVRARRRCHAVESRSFCITVLCFVIPYAESRHLASDLYISAWVLSQAPMTCLSC